MLDEAVYIYYNLGADVAFVRFSDVCVYNAEVGVDAERSR